MLGSNRVIISGSPPQKIPDPIHSSTSWGKWSVQTLKNMPSDLFVLASRIIGTCFCFSLSTVAFLGHTFVGAPLKLVGSMCFGYEVDVLGPVYRALYEIPKTIINPDLLRTYNVLMGKEELAAVEQKHDGSKTILSQSHRTSGGDTIYEQTVIEEKSWMSCNAVRDSLKKASSVVAWLADLKPCIPNLMQHRVIDGTGKVISQTARFGAITDPRYGYYSLKDLKIIAKELESFKRSNHLVELKNRLYKPGEKIEKKLAENPKAVEYLEESKRQLNSIKTLKDVQKIIDERTAWCGSQFLQLLTSQIENNVNSINELQDNKPFKMINLSLVHEDAKIEKAGLMHDERVIRNDMKKTFRAFADYSIEFDEVCKEPKIDRNKKVIRMPRPDGLKQSVHKVQFKPVLFNISIQKKIANTKSQKQLNEQALKNLGVASPINDPDFNFFFDKKKLTSEDASHLMSILRREYPLSVFSVNCYSGKDRTGEVVAKDAQQNTEKWFIDSHLDNSESPLIAKKKALNVPSMGAIYTTSLSAKVVEYNTGVRFLKIVPLFMPDKIKGCKQCGSYAIGYFRALLLGNKIAD